jgi:acetoin utilization protein AcuB
MKRHAPEVSEYMSHLPLEAEQCESAGEASALMQEHQIHHLPVMSGSHLKGVITRQGLLEARLRLGDDFDGTSLQSICQDTSILVSPVDPIDGVCRQLLETGDDHAVVMDGGFVVGILTTTDILRFVADFFGRG